MGRGDRVGDRRIRDADVDDPEVGKLVADEIDLEVTALGDVERRHLEAVGLQPLGDRGADPDGRSGDERSRDQGPPHERSVSWVPARPASVFS